MNSSACVVYCCCFFWYLRHGANLSAENRDHITALVLAAQNECSGAFQVLMQLMDEPIKTIFKMMDLMVDHAQILMVSFSKFYCCETTFVI